MNKFYSYINSAIYNIRHNKAYAAFCIFGTALTFIFISIVLQLTNDVVNNTAPFVNADREISLGRGVYFKDNKGHGIGGIQHNEIPLFLKNLKEYELCALRGQQLGAVSVSNKFTSTAIMTLVNGDYWKINEFDFIAGRPFTEEEVTSKTPVVVIKKNFAESNFKTDEVLGQKVEFQHVMYTIIGIVDEYSNILNGSEEVWIPHTFNTFMPDMNKYYSMNILPKQGIAIDDFKDNVVTALKFYFKNKSTDIDIDRDDILTRQEGRIEMIGGNTLSSGIGIVLLILLVIPAINIVVISVANINNRAKEIAIRRSMGATVFSSFLLIMLENILLVTIGAIVGVLLAVPTVNLINILFLSDGLMDILLITNVDLLVLIFGVFPLSLLFALLSGGIPAYLVARGKISKILKEDFNKNGNSIKRFSGIFIEQVLVFIILMLSMVSISKAVDKYNEPGLLDTENVVYFGYSPINSSADNLDEVSRNMDVLVENLKKSSNVIALSEEWMVVPYIRGNSNESDSITVDKTKIKAYTKWTDKYAKSIYNFELIEGDWITDENLPDGSEQVVITKDIADTLKWNESVGKKLSVRNRNYTVVGVIGGFKQESVYGQSAPTIIMPNPVRTNQFRELSVRVEDMDIFITDLHKEWNELMKEDATLLFFDLDKLGNMSMFEVTINLILQTIPTLFLLIFAFIGTFGIFWLTSQKRIKEFALRIAIGSTPKGLTWLVIKESIIITTLAMVPGLLLSIFIYEGEFTLVHIIAIGITAILMLLFSIFSAWYPAYTVSKINPAKAIKYE